MPEITFTTVPDADDVEIDDVSMYNIAAFRSECLTDGTVTCDWGTLRARLENHDVSRFWWFLTELERRSIAEMAIKNTLFFHIGYKCTGRPACEGCDGEWSEATCLYDTVVKYPIFSEYRSDDSDMCYWKKTLDDVEHCVKTNVSYGLPCNVVFCSPVFGHVLLAIQVVNNIESLDNWIVFQYGSFDIKPGHWQMPTGQVAEIWDVYNISNCGHLDYNIVTEFNV